MGTIPILPPLQSLCLLCGFRSDVAGMLEHSIDCEAPENRPCDCPDDTPLPWSNDGHGVRGYRLRCASCGTRW